jgi:hypothetical protein
LCVSVIVRLGGCVAITLKYKFVILNEVKNLTRPMGCKTEILRLGPQNDIAEQPLDRTMTEHIEKTGFTDQVRE